MKYLVNDYTIIEFKKSPILHKKYRVYLKNKNTLKIKHLDFGDDRYENYWDKTGLNLYSTHRDPERRRRYRLRAKIHVDDKYYTPAYFSYYYLW